MEQQEREQRKQTTSQETSHNEPQRQQRSFTELAAQALLNGAAVWELPRQPLEELAERVGNSNMLALAAMHGPQADLQQTVLAGDVPGTAPTEVPETACQLAPAADLTTGAWPANAFDPAALA